MKIARSTIPVFFIVLVALACVSCSGGSDDDDNDDAADDVSADDFAADDAVDDAANDTQDDDTLPSRPFYLAAAPVKFEMTDWEAWIVFDTAGFENRVDMLSAHMDFFGIPWDEFATGAELPAAWTAVMTDIRDQAQALGVPIYLSLTPLSGMRTTLAAKASDVGGKLTLAEGWAPECYDFATGPGAEGVRLAYRNYVEWMIEFFEPRFLTNVIEINLYDVACPDAWASVVDLANEIYGEAKELRPDLPVFPTWVLQSLYRYAEEGGCEIGDKSCLTASLAEQAELKRDRFGISAYPLFLSNEWQEIPEDYFSAVSDITGDRIVFGETGYGSYPVSIPTPDDPNVCWQVFQSSDEDETAYMQFLFEQAENLGSDLVTWWSLRDYLIEDMLTNCPCDAPGIWCAIYDGVEESGLLPLWLSWGAMGVIDYDMNLKPAFELWNEWRARPIAE